MLVRDLEAQGYNQSYIDNEIKALGPAADSKIGYCFPAMGLAIVLAALGYLYFGSQTIRNAKASSDTNSKSEEQNGHELSTAHKIMLFLLLIFFFVYAGIEYNMGVYLTTFAVECKLALTKYQGTRITAIFWGAFATMRFLAIFAAIKFNASHVMIFSISVSLIAAVPLVFWAESFILLLQILSGVAGFGMASIYATGFVWLEQHLVVTNKMAAAFGIAVSLGPDVFPTLIGQFIAHYPMVLMYVNLGGVLTCAMLFFGAALITKKFAGKNILETQTVDTNMDIMT